ncbi:Venom metalloproteinase antarease-like TserMP_B-like [Homarus americanus]|uniref:Venom metalloproteinase antarease-like TserMP_B-like n=1 Tax=Homarus americanus TaxID=6706 RepID=A0A8J5MWP1_HOMAM|nr:Venom metalloproteinase antarease-like TserMP_B-like [Homarus americanus]
MKTLAALLAVSCWGALSHASVVRTRPLKSSPATVRLSSPRSPLEPLHLQVEAFGQRHNLRLQPALSPLSVDFKLQRTAINEQGQVIIEDVAMEGEDAPLYEDPETGSVVTLDDNKVEGIITPTLTLMAASDGTHQAVRQYSAMPLHETRDYLEVPSGVLYNQNSSTNTRAVTSVSPEVYIIVDSTLAKQLGSNTKVRKYLSVFWNAVNQRYAAISDPKIKLVLSGALIVRKSAHEPYINDNFLLDNYIDGANTLNSVSDWLFQKKDDLSAYDLAYLMTGKDMADVQAGTIKEGLSGIAWKGAACVVAEANKRSFNTGMGEDQGAYYVGVMTAAHEVAHNLGSPHDGEGEATSCSWDDGYIMSYVSGKLNKLLFSPCSQKLMKKYFMTSDADCLHKAAMVPTINLSSKLPGELIPMDKQCQKATGQTNAFASKQVSEDSLCVELVCQWKVKEGNSVFTYTKSTGDPAAEGSACRSGGVCTDGSCQ